MKITKDFLDFVCKDYQEDFAFDVYNNYYADQQVPYDVFLSKLNELIEQPENTNRWTIIDRLPYLPEAIMYDQTTFEYTNKFFTSDKQSFDSIEQAQAHNTSRAANINIVNLCVISVVEKNNNAFTHKDRITNLDQISDDPQQWFGFFKPSTGQTFYIQGKQHLLNNLSTEHQFECQRRFIYKISQQVRDTEHGFTAEFEILDGPY